MQELKFVKSDIRASMVQTAWQLKTAGCVCEVGLRRLKRTLA